MHEFSLIAKYFTRAPQHTVLGVGDDCALIAPAAGMQLAVTTDTLVEAVHFFKGTPARALGHKALAVNLSDLAAMGAVPRWATLAITLPAVDEAWLADFAEGLFALADEHSVDLIGGDTTRGPLAFTLTLMGEVPVGAALTRDGAKPGDDIWLTGDVGGPALAVAERYGRLSLSQWDVASDAIASAHKKLDMPTPRVAFGLALHGIARAAIDVSDGLAQDLGHIVARSSMHAPCSAVIDFAALPLHAAARAAYGSRTTEVAGVAVSAVLAGGDEYELAFTAASDKRTAIEQIARDLGVPCTRIGRIENGGTGVVVMGLDGQPMRFGTGFNHFASNS
jgi:thiamine-monophosphate kinase